MQKVKHRQGCNCCQAGKIIRVTVLGCNGYPLEGALVEATRLSVTYSATSDATGIADVEIPDTGAFASYSVKVSRAMFVDNTNNESVLIADTIKLVTRTLAADATHQCQSWESTAGGAGGRDCVLPLPATLFLTDSAYGAVTMTLSKTGSPRWSGSKSITVPACESCTAATVTMQYALVADFRAAGPTAASFCLSMTYRRDFFNCPDPTGTSTLPTGDVILLMPGDVTCPTAFFSTHTYVYDPLDDARIRTHCDGTYTFTISE